MVDLLFGLNLPTSAAPGADPVAVATAAEELGFDFVSANDHPSGTSPTFEVWTLLAWIAARTSRIRIASRVLGVPYRPPAMVAKMAESLQRLSGGRLVLGVGGGASDEEFRAFGLGVRTPGEKVEGLEEAVRIIRGLWSEPNFSFRGTRYRTEEAPLEPKPEQRIPIWLGTFGPRALDVTGRLADGWIPSIELAPPERAKGMLARIQAAALEAGRDPAEITCVYNMQIRIDDTPDPRESVVSGPADEVSGRLSDYVNLGFTAFNFILTGPGQDEQRARLANVVIPAVREAVR